MPDITKCKGENCPMKDICYRYTSKPDEYQSYFTESPIENNECEYLWDVEKTDPKIFDE